MSSTADLLDTAGRHLLRNYKQPPLVMTRGEGCYLWDTDGRRYLDLYAGIAVCVLGHAHPALVRALTEQARLDRTSKEANTHAHTHTRTHARTHTPYPRRSLRSGERSYIGTSPPVESWSQPGTSPRTPSMPTSQAPPPPCGSTARPTRRELAELQSGNPPDPLSGKAEAETGWR